MDSIGLAMEIINCGLRCSENAACRGLLEAQGCSGINDFHVPEPWNGDIDNAKVMVFSVNPRYTPGELYPRLGNKYWTNSENGGFNAEKVFDFFKNRFSSESRYVTHEDGRSFRIKMENGRMVSPGGRYWLQVNAAVGVILGRKVQPGEEYIITELAHCKTVNENMAMPCCQRCIRLWFDKVLEVAKKVEHILVPGTVPMRYIAGKFHISRPKQYKQYLVDWHGRVLNIVFVPHPAAFGGGIDMDCLSKALKK